MKVSLNTIKQFIDFELPPIAELRKRINEQLGQTEGITDLGEKYKGIVIVNVVSAVKHPNADKLSVCLVDDGGVVQNVPRDENGHVQVVCGAPNVYAGMFAIWLPPAVTVPSSFDDAEPFVLSARELRGVVSNGMLAAADELALGSDHAGIIELTNADLAEGALAPGMDFAATFGLNDRLIDIENKMFTHRPDCFGQLGVAREIAGILGHQFKSPSWYLHAPEFTPAAGLELNVFNDAKQKVPRFMAVALKNVTIKPSPFWLQCELVRLGSKPINNVVDITNYLMLVTAQPLHAYDYDKLAGRTLGVRMGHEGEQLPLLNGKTYEVTPDDIVIVDGEKPIGMGGIMGGGNSEVSAKTKNIVLECATFDMYTIRKTSMRHGLFTDAVTRFNKGQSPLQNPAITARAIALFTELAGGEQASVVYDESTECVPAEDVKVGAQFINERLGSSFTDAEIIGLLQNVEVSADNIDEHDAPLYVLAPFWRTDIELPEDVVEEVGRLHGFDTLPRELPTRSIKPAPKNQKRAIAHAIRQSLSRNGANEVLTYSFVHKNVLDRAAQDSALAFRLGNALSPDLQYYRLSVLPSLLDKVHGNVKAGYDEFTLFEIGKGHNKERLQGDGLPAELEFVDAVYVSKKPREGAAFYHMRSLASQLAHDMGITFVFAPVSKAMNDPITAPFELTRSAMVTSQSGEFIGIVGELKQGVARGFKLPEYTAAMSLGLQGLINTHAVQNTTYTPLSRFPLVLQDISLRVPAHINYAAVYDTCVAAAAEHADSNVSVNLAPLSIYQGSDTGYKTITLRATVTHYGKTLSDADVAPILDAVAAAAAKAFNAERV